MCFSAAASFTVGSALGIIGALCVKKTKSWRLGLIAIFPLLFAIQQLSEGIVWLHMNGKLELNLLSRTAQMTNLVLAWLVWPIFVPISFFIAERDTWRRTICVTAFLIGILIVYVDAKFLWNETVIATVVGRSIYYPASPHYGNLLYGFSTIVPILLSSIKQMWIFGFALLISFVASEIIWHFTFTSVWCFFAATASLFLLRILSSEKS